MLASSPKTSGTWVALLGLALIACGGRTTGLGGTGSSSGGSGGGSGSGSGGFPYSGPSCTTATITDACWSCVQNRCPSFVSCVTSDCSAYFGCYCACPLGDATCVQSCQGDLSSACSSCVDAAAQCVGQSCDPACAATMTGGGGATGSSGGGSVTTECSSTTTICKNGQPLKACMTFENGACTGATYIAGEAQVLCASCTDTTACQQQANAACQ